MGWWRKKESTKTEAAINQTISWVRNNITFRRGDWIIFYGSREVKRRPGHYRDQEENRCPRCHSSLATEKQERIYRCIPVGSPRANKVAIEWLRSVVDEYWRFGYRWAEDEIGFRLKNEQWEVPIFSDRLLPNIYEVIDKYGKNVLRTHIVKAIKEQGVKLKES